MEARQRELLREEEVEAQAPTVKAKSKMTKVRCMYDIKCLEPVCVVVGLDWTGLDGTAARRVKRSALKVGSSRKGCAI